MKTFYLVLLVSPFVMITFMIASFTYMSITSAQTQTTSDLHSTLSNESISGKSLSNNSAPVQKIITP